MYGQTDWSEAAESVKQMCECDPIEVVILHECVIERNESLTTTAAATADKKYNMRYATQFKRLFSQTGSTNSKSTKKLYHFLFSLPNDPSKTISRIHLTTALPSQSAVSRLLLPLHHSIWNKFSFLMSPMNENHLNKSPVNCEHRVSQCIAISSRFLAVFFLV